MLTKFLAELNNYKVANDEDLQSFLESAFQEAIKEMTAHPEIKSLRNKQSFICDYVDSKITNALSTPIAICLMVLSFGINMHADNPSEMLELVIDKLREWAKLYCIKTSEALWPKLLQSNKIEREMEEKTEDPSMLKQNLKSRRIPAYAEKIVNVQKGLDDQAFVNGTIKLREVHTSIFYT